MLIRLPGNIPVDKLPEKALEKLYTIPATLVGWEVLDSDENGRLDAYDDYISQNSEGTDTIIDLGAASGGAPGIDTITVLDVLDLTAGDFIF